MTLVDLHKKYYSIPTTWNELSTKQLLQSINILYSQQTIADAQIKLLKILSGIKWWRLWLAGALEFDDKLYLTDFLFEENTLTKNLLPSYDGMHGPADDFSNLRISEFIFSDVFYQQYKENGEGESDLNMLIATLYRPAKKGYDFTRNPDGDCREKYNDNLTAYYAIRVSGWCDSVKLAVLHWYEACRTKLIKDNPDVFGGAGGGQAAKHGLWSVMRGVAEKGIHGNINTVEDMYVKVFMMELNELLAEAERIQKLSKQRAVNL